MKKAEPADFPAFEAEMLKVWDKEKTFQKSLEARKDAKHFSFYDGPPFANGLPHYGHVVAITEKDSMTRYKTMRGYLVPRRNGWDTHGLPVEYELEKQLGISGKKQIQEMGVDKFNEAARASVFKYKEQWEEFMTRMGRWADQDSYATLDDDYIESVWWVLSELFKKKLVYRGFRSNPYCPRCATPLSNFELNQGYKDGVKDPSVYAMFPLVDDPSTALLAWTTTPWTLPANASLAVKPEADYVTVELTAKPDEWQVHKLILAKDRLSELELRKTEYKVTATQKGRELVGLGYVPLYEIEDKTSTTHTVIAAEGVSLEDGTGILHVAPAYGEEDLDLGQKHDLTMVQSVDSNGIQQVGPKESLGLFFKEADPYIIADLAGKGRIFAAETFEHTYPFCWRCETPLLYFAMPSWFIKVTDLRDKLVKNNDQINWVPDHIKQGRFGNWLAEARDWNFSRNRFWGAPLPIWVNEADEDDLIVIGSLNELRELSGDKEFDLHRPGIDNVVIKRDGKTYKRVEEVFDCWFESGAMPYAQDHYPFENEAEFKDKFPAEFIAEGLDQTRGWFYTLHVLGTALFDQPAFKNVIVHGTVLAADGQKLSKRLRNYPDPSEIFESTGADSLRFFLMSSPVENGEDVRFSFDTVNEVKRNVFMTLYNVYSFFATYAEVDGWQPGKQLERPEVKHLLDRWLLARLDETIAEVTKHADAYQIARATRPLRDLIEDLSNWYVRRSRRRFWKSENDGDKNEAYATLHYVLVRITQLLAPWSPFLSDKIYRELTDGMDVPDSVHLTDWPETEEVDTELIGQMFALREAVTIGLAQRAEAKIKVRQPLAEAIITAPAKLSNELLNIASEELNVKNVQYKEGSEMAVKLDTEITQELKQEGLAREIIRQIQAARKSADLQVDDRIELVLGTDSAELKQALETNSDLIAKETLATDLKIVEKGSEVPALIEGMDLTIELGKA
ncbi:MAG TPA: isoleucine--tRNA ligase [Candidatus Nanoarchaeia archaeon]|nr:isoleucine--tRNA ligase [Candidatus Nanoarchaeia archaeon]